MIQPDPVTLARLGTSGQKHNIRCCQLALCAVARKHRVFPKPKYSSGEGREETDCLQDKKSLQTGDG